MAVLHQSKNNLKEKIRQNQMVSVGAWLFFIVYMILSTVNEWFQMLFTLPLFFAMGTSYFFGHKNKILQVGLDGEKKALSLIKDLDDTYHVFANGEVKFEGQRSELDLIVVSQKGVFVVEVKNLKGEIEGNESDRFWMQHKIGRKGARYSQEFYSPVKQVGTHVYRLSKLLKAEGVYTWVQGVVYFVHEEVDIERVNSVHTPVLSSETGLHDFLRTLDKKEDVTEEKVERIVSILNSRIQ